MRKLRTLTYPEGMSKMALFWSMVRQTRLISSTLASSRRCFRAENTNPGRWISVPAWNCSVVKSSWAVSSERACIRIECCYRSGNTDAGCWVSMHSMALQQYDRPGPVCPDERFKTLLMRSSCKPFWHGQCLCTPQRRCSSDRHCFASLLSCQPLQLLHLDMIR